MSTETADRTADLPIDGLRERLSGRVILPTDEEYDPDNVLRLNTNIPPAAAS